MALSTALLASVAAVLLMALAQPSVDAHAVMIKPESRAWFDYLLRYNYNPHAVYGGGVNEISNNGKLSWPSRRRHSICGDAWNETKWDTPGPMAWSGKYKAGQTVNVDVLFAQNHMGLMQLRVCPLDAAKESQCKVRACAGVWVGNGTRDHIPITRVCLRGCSPHAPRVTGERQGWPYVVCLDGSSWVLD